MSASDSALPAERRLSQPEFIALMAMLFATIAFSIDAMLPAMGEIAAEVTPEVPNRAQLIITFFVLGMGVGTLFTGPLSDAFGRKPVVLAAAALYCVAALVAALAQSLELLLAARLVQGLGAAGPRVVALAIIRDVYAGRTMAKLMSFVMMVFTLVPAIAPSLGALIIWGFGWRGIFVAFVAFSMIGATWLALRQPETLPREARRPFRPAPLFAGVTEILSYPVARGAILVQTLCFAMLFLTLSTTQMVFDQAFDQGHTFHLWFGGIALIAASASFLNALLVERLGMRRLVRAMLNVQVWLTGAYCLSLLVLDLPYGWALGAYVLWVVGMFFQAGMTIGNLNALAMEPLGHLAGLAASVIGAIATVGSVALAMPLGQLFDGTPVPIALGTLGLATAAFWLTLRLPTSDESGAPPTRSSGA